jgi:hypothetical protein
MSARDYQHKRFRSRGTDSGGTDDYDGAPPSFSLSVNPGIGGDHHPSMMSHTPPRVVTPMSHHTPSPNKENKRSSELAATNSPDFLHEPTATKGSLTYVSPLKPDRPDMRYSLKNGLKDPSSNDIADESYPKNSSSRSKKNTTGGSSSSSSKLLSTSIRKHDPSSYKIFILLLQPKLKTFELIQLIYSPNDTTIGNIIEMIPENATEPALGNQVYTGLCRPKTLEEIIDRELLASETHTDVHSAKITLGEILVAIPDGYTGADVAVLAKQILANPKIVKLLKRADPLAPKRSRRSSRRHKSSRRSRSKEHVEVMEKFDEEDEIKLEQERKMKEAMEHAAQEAAAANAQIPGGGSTSGTGIGKLTRSMSIGSVEDKSVESSLQESLDDSYSSWSKSFDASFASSVCSGVSKRQMRRRERQVRRSRIVKRAAAMAFVIMLALYFLDPRGYSGANKAKNDLVTESPMGLTGVFQCLFLLLALYKIERFIRTSSNPDADEDGQKNRCPFIKAANSAAKRFKTRYARKLKKPVIQGRFGSSEDDDQSLSRKLRSFSLKAPTINHHDDMGSL